MQSMLGRLQGMFQRCARSLDFSLRKRSTMLTTLCQKCRTIYAPVAAKKYAGHCCDKVATGTTQWTSGCSMEDVYMCRSWLTS